MSVPSERVRARNQPAARPERAFVLYWMIVARRTRFNFALERAVEAARAWGKPLVVLEALRCDYPYASDRFHRFVLDGMADNAARLSRAAIGYRAYVEPARGAGKGLLEELAKNACLVVTDDYPAFFLPRMVEAAAKRLDVRLEAVDANGLLPLEDADHAFPTAYAFRRHLQRRLPDHLTRLPEPDPLAGTGLPPSRFPEDVASRWPSAEALEGLPIDHRIVPVDGVSGGPEAARERLTTFVEERLPGYAEHRNEPDRETTSGLSPYLHFGHVSIHEVLLAVAGREGWSPASLAATANGKREGWWGLSPSAEAFLDQAVTWRELGFNHAATGGDDRFESLPAWARRTLAEHAADPRPHRYDLSDLEAGATHDRLWNAAQAQLVREGRIHNYLRMLWGKKILEWTAGPEEALDVLFELNDRYALDGRDPNSSSGICWILGRYDRPWGPTRPIFGTVRYMSSENTARKMSVAGYLRRFE
jgi:deoxyribodipyrimidine photo-lyase